MEFIGNISEETCEEIKQCPDEKNSSQGLEQGCEPKKHSISGLAYRSRGTNRHTRGTSEFPGILSDALAAEIFHASRTSCSRRPLVMNSTVDTGKPTSHLQCLSSSLQSPCPVRVLSPTGFASSTSATQGVPPLPPEKTREKVQQRGHRPKPHHRWQCL